MNPKMKSAIEKITLNDATFSNEVIEPTYVNFFYGKNGAGKSTIARTFKANDERLQWQAGKASTDYDVLVYDTDFINANLRNYGNLAGVFTVNETNIAIQEQVDTLNAERKKMGEEYNGHKAAIDQKTADKNTALSTFQSDCWSKSAEARTLFDEAIKGKKKAALFAQEILAITPVAHDVEDLKTLYGTVFSGDAQQYNMLSKAGKVTYASLPGYELMGKPISSSSDTDFAKFIKALKATDWVRSGHTHFAGQTDGKCPYCQQKLPSNFDKEIAACFDAQYQDDISAINAFQRTYESEMDSVVATLEGNVSAAMPELDLSEYEVKVQLLVDAITINKQRIAAKIKEPTSIASLEDTDSLLIEIGTLIDGFNKKIKENNEIVRDLKTKKVLCKKQVWEYLAELLKADVAAYNKALSDLDTEIKALKDKMEQLKKDATAKKKEANELNKQIVNTEATIDRLASFVDEQRMCRLYEKFILEYYSRHYPELSVSASQIPWSLDDGIGTMLPVMQSDIHLQRGNTVLIIDAKYYSHTTQSQFDKHTIHSNNLYQIFTYVKNRSYQFGEEKNTVSGMLLYAKTEEEIQPDNVYQMHGSQISVKTLDLNQPFAEIANQMDRIVESHFSGLAKKY